MEIINTDPVRYSRSNGADSAPSFLKSEGLQLVIFGGKGGSGKTTSAAATAIYLVQRKPERRILVVSTDPAHSLGDSFSCPIGNKVTPIKGVDNLWALEMDAPELLENYRRKNDKVIKKIADRGTYFDQEDIANFLNLSLPGMDEVMAVIEIANILKADQYDLVILDTAPTGHTIRLLALPEQMEKWVQIMNMMMEKHRYMSKHFTGNYRKDECDRFLEEQERDVQRVKLILKDSRVTEFVPVTIPEPMSIEETEKLITCLKDYEISVKNVIINRLAREGGQHHWRECVFCKSRKRDQEEFIGEINNKFAPYNLVRVPLLPFEVRGIEKLKDYAKILSEGDYQETPLPSQVRTCGVEPFSEISTSATATQPEADEPLAQMSDLLQKDLQFILIGGKGGVGKTSIAAATALRIARQNPDKKVIAFSTDPAHSLGDSFGYPIGDKITPINGVDNLYAFELNPARLLEDLKNEYRKDIEKVFDKFLGGGIDIKFDREVMEELFMVAPPGLDEIMALKKIVDLAEANEFDLYVLDNAATGHLIRFLELPNIVRDWLKTIFRLLLKYKGVVKLTKSAERMLELSKSVRKIQEILTDSKRCEFVVVTIPEAMGVLEMDDLLLTLRKLKIPCHHIAINMVIPPTECNFCLSKRKEQQGYIKQVSTGFTGYTLALIPLFPHEIRGIDNLTKLSEIMYGSMERRWG